MPNPPHAGVTLRVPDFFQAFGERELASVTSEEILEFLEATSSHLAPGTRKLRFYQLKAFFNFCRIHQSLRITPAMAAGIMIAASFVGLVVPALELGSIAEVSAGLIAGAIALWALGRLIPHIHLGYSGESRLGISVGRALLVAGAVTLHNLPEGFAVGAAYFSGDASLGLILAVALGAHNIPEGIVVALPLRAAGVSRKKALWAATASGLAEPVGALVSIVLFGIVSTLTPLFLAFVAGAMIFVTSHELIPESHSHGHEDLASMAVVFGFIFMLLLERFLR